jgi:hypothetical protein
MLAYGSAARYLYLSELAGPLVALRPMCHEASIKSTIEIIDEQFLKKAIFTEVRFC